MAEAQGIEIAPHNPLSPISLGACLQLAFSVPNFAIQEYPTGFENMVLKSGERLLGSNIATNVPQVVNGFIAISDAPGIGVELVENPEAIRPPVKRPVSMRHNLDGSPLDQ